VACELGNGGWTFRLRKPSGKRVPECVPVVAWTDFAVVAEFFEMFEQLVSVVPAVAKQQRPCGVAL